VTGGRRRLGRGLEALLGPTTVEEAREEGSLREITISDIRPNPFQPRHAFDKEQLDELAASMNGSGLLQPIVVRPTDDDAFELIAGERRWRAAQQLGWERIAAVVREADDRTVLTFALIENLQREDLNPVDRARAFKQLAEEFKLSHAQVAKKVGRSRVYVSNTLRLLLLPEVIIDSMRHGEISEGHGRTLLMLNDRPEEQDTLYRETLLKKLSVRDVERISRKIAADKVRKKDWGIDPELIEIEKHLTESLGTRVQIEKKDFGGKLVIDYFSPEDLHKIVGMIEAQGTLSDQKQMVKEQSASIESATPLSFHSKEIEGERSAPMAHGERATHDNVESDEPSTLVDDRPESEKDDEDPDLYAIKNFTL